MAALAELALMELTPENYHSHEANQQYMSVSQYKSFIECSARAKAEIDGRYKRPQGKPLWVGKYGHKWVENGKQEEYLAENYEEFLDVELIGKKGGKNAELRRMDEVTIPSCESDDIIMLALEGEKEVIFTAELFGVQFKAMLDVYNPKQGYFSDPKFMGDMKPQWNKKLHMYQSFIVFWGYHIQMVVYSEIERIATGRKGRLRPHLVVVTKEKVTKKKIFKGFDKPSVVREILGEVESELQHIMMIKNGEVEPENCGDCAYCRQTMETEIVNFNEID
jgi:hypothetical protein